MLRLKYFSFLRLSGRIFWAFMLLALLALVTGIVSNLLLSDSSDSNDNINLQLKEYNQAIVVNNSIQALDDTISKQLSSNASNYSSLIRDYLFQAPSDLLDLEKIVEAEPDADIKVSYVMLAQKFAAAYYSYRDTADAIGKPSALAANIYDSSQNYRAQLTAAINNFIQDRKQTLYSNQRADSTFVALTRWITLTMAIVSFMLALLLALAVTQGFAKRINRLIAKLGQVANGDLTEQLKVQGNDEIAELSLIFNRTIASLKLTIARIQAQANAISNTSGQIEISSISQASSLSEQAVAIAQASVTIEELSGTGHQIADSAILVANSATNALSSAEQGYETTHAADEMMVNIRKRVNQIADSILALNSLAQRIREITKLIDNIANETHLLALNAAIESAGAGEEGQRFGVVASNVRRLAQRSRVATVEIQQLVNEIQKAAATSVMATEEGVKTVAQGEEMLHLSLAAQEVIINQVTQTNELANAISLATDQQRLANQQVADTMRELSRIINDISVASQQYRIGVTDLTGVVVQLNEVANDFTLDKSANSSAPLALKQGQKPILQLSAAADS